MQPDFHNLGVFGPFQPAELGLGPGNRELWNSVKEHRVCEQEETDSRGVVARPHSATPESRKWLGPTQQLPIRSDIYYISAL